METSRAIHSPYTERRGKAISLVGGKRVLQQNRSKSAINYRGVGVRLQAAEAANLQFSKDIIVPFEPKGRKNTREWIQINHENSADYEKGLEIFQSSIAVVKVAKGWVR